MPSGLAKYTDSWSHSLFPGYDFKHRGHPTIGYYASAVVGTLVIAGGVLGLCKLTQAVRRRHDTAEVDDLPLQPTASAR